MAAQIPAYDTSTNPRGFGIIIVNRFLHDEELRREGADKEEENLTKLFQSLGLVTHVYPNLTKQQIQYLLTKVSLLSQLGEHSMIAVAIR